MPHGMDLLLLLQIIGIVLSAVIFWNGWRGSLLRHFPIFYSYIAISSLGSTALGAWSFARFGGTGYAEAYFTLLLVRQVLEISIFAKLYTRFRMQNDQHMWQLLAAVTGTMAVFLLVHVGSGQSTFGSYPFLVTVLLQFQTLFCALTLGHVALNRRVSIGWNQFVIISGLAISILFKYIGWALVASDLIEFNVLRPWIQPIEIVPWIIWAVSMRDYFPTRELPESDFAELEAQRRECEKAVKSLLQR